MIGMAIPGLFRRRRPRLQRCCTIMDTPLPPSGNGTIRRSMRRRRWDRSAAGRPATASTISTASSAGKRRSGSPGLRKHQPGRAAASRPDLSSDGRSRDHAIDWIRKRQVYAHDKPFLLYWTPGAVHGPHHIFKAWADKYKGKFDDGWDAYRDRVFARQKAMDWIPAGHEAHAAPRHSSGSGTHSRPKSASFKRG